MTDIFISYAHEDQAVVRRMATALEAEGFSVWWDHTIPPGKTWDQVIAKGIEDARCCIVLWSHHSVGSDWVKEEATIAKDGRKFLPAQIDDAQPPVGFRRIQAAQLGSWTGDARDPQWQMLVREARSIVTSSRAGPASAPAPDANTPVTPRPQPQVVSRGGGVPVIAVVGIVAALLIAGAAGFVFLNRPPTEAVVAEQAPPAAAPPGAAPPGSLQHDEELEQLRREAELAAATQAKAEQDLAASRAAPGATPTPAPQRTTPPPVVSSASSAWTLERVDALAGAWSPNAPANFTTQRPGFFIISTRSRTEDGYAAIGAIVRVLERDSVGARVRVVYGYSRGCETGWWVDDQLLTYLGPDYDSSWERISDELHRRRETEQMPNRCGGASSRGASTAQASPAASSGGWTPDRIRAQMGAWTNATGGYYMVARDEGGHAGYVSAGSIVRITRCSGPDQTCEVDIRFGRGSTGCDGWVTTGRNLTFLGARYDRSWEPVSTQLTEADRYRDRLRTACASR